MVSIRRGVREFLVLTLPLLVCASATCASRGLAAEDKCEKPESAPAKKTTSVLRAIVSALGASGAQSDAKPASPADAKKQQEEAMKKAMEEAQAAYEKQKRELQDRLRSDPLWKPSHEQVRVIKVSEYVENPVVNSFCLNKDGNLLICCGRGARDQSNLPGGHIVVINPDGKKLDVWELPFALQAICMASDETIYVGGAGKLSKLDRDGKVLLTADSPSVAELPPPPTASEKDPEPQGDAAESFRKAEQKEIADLKEKVREAEKEYQKIAKEAAKNVKPDDDASLEAFHAKVKEPLETYRALQEKLMNLTTSPEARAARLRMEREQRLTITGMAVTDKDLFLACRSAKGYGYAVWRTDRDFTNPKKVVQNLAGCCGQMDIQANEGELWIAHNARHKVERYDRDGKKLSSFGKTDRTNADGFGGCCEPKNLRFASNDEVFAAESGPPTCVKRFTTAGKFLGVMAVAPWDSGCVRVTTEFRRDLDQFFVLNSGERTIHVFAKKPAETAAQQSEAASQDTK